MKKLLTYGLIAGVLSLAACRESETIYIYPPSPMDDAQDFVTKYGPELQTFSMFTTELPKTVTLNNGTKITVPHAAIQKNGNYVSGEITVEAYEMLKRSDIILGGINTNHFDGSPIESQGILSVNILSANKNADRNLLNLMSVSFPSGQAGHMKISSGNTNANGTGCMAWGPDMLDSINSDGSVYSFQTMKIGWLNCGMYYAHDMASGNLTVTLENNPGNIASYRGEQGNTFVYFCPAGRKVAMQLHLPAGTDKVKSKDNMMPVGSTGKLVSFSVKDRKFYYAEKEINTTENGAETLVLAEVSIDVLLTKIRALDTY